MITQIPPKDNSSAASKKRRPNDEMVLSIQQPLVSSSRPNSKHRITGGMAANGNISRYPMRIRNNMTQPQMIPMVFTADSNAFGSVVAGFRRRSHAAPACRGMHRAVKRADSIRTPHNTQTVQGCGNS